ncbi:MAG: adenosylmethionine decarboxylase [Candidatus Izemoplasmatales bacterium]
MENIFFGPHLTMDLSNCNKEKLSDYSFIFNLLSELPEKIGMTKITQPYVFPYKGLVPDDSGITGVVIIAESHISIHSFEQKDYVFIDVFSCKNFDVNIAKKYFIDAFESKTVKCHTINRGANFPR